MGSSSAGNLARMKAIAAGLQYVYTGNVSDPDPRKRDRQVNRQNTYCPTCNKLLIERNWYELGQYHLDGDRCRFCGQALPGVFDRHPGTWGRRRLPIRVTTH